MNLSIRYLGNLKRPWLLYREGGDYDQHAHMRTREDAEMVRKLIDACKYPYCDDYRIAMQRLLTQKEFKMLKKKDGYYNPKGMRG